MHTVEKVMRTIKGERTEIDFLFGSGRLTANPPEIRPVGSSYQVLNAHGFSLKFSNGKDKKPDYYPVEFWGKNAEHMYKLGYEGQLIEVSGRIVTKQYKNHAGEDKESKTLVIERFTCLEYKSNEKTNTGESSTSTDIDSSTTQDGVEEKVGEAEVNKEPVVENDQTSADISSTIESDFTQSDENDGFDDLPF